MRFTRSERRALREAMRPVARRHRDFSGVRWVILGAVLALPVPSWAMGVGIRVSPGIAGSSTLGLVQGDGATLNISSAGVLSIPSNSTWAGSTNITTLGTVTSGTWTGTSIAVANGGTGATTAAGARTNLGAANIAGDTFTGTLNVGTSNQGQILTTGVASFSAGTFTGDLKDDEASEPILRLYSDNSSANNRNWAVAASDLAFGDFAIKTSNALGGDPKSAGTTRFYISPLTGDVGLGTTTDSGTLSIGSGNGIWINGNQFADNNRNISGSVLTTTTAAISAAASWSANTDTMFVTTGAGGVQLDLPAASAANVGKWLHAIKVDSATGSLTVKANNSTDTLNGTTNGTATASTQWKELQCTGYQSTGWICAGPI